MCEHHRTYIHEKYEIQLTVMTSLNVAVLKTNSNIYSVAPRLFVKVRVSAVILVLWWGKSHIAIRKIVCMGLLLVPALTFYAVFCFRLGSKIFQALIADQTFRFIFKNKQLKKSNFEFFFFASWSQALVSVYKFWHPYTKK
jgi:hypothetical protein